MEKAVLHKRRGAKTWDFVPSKRYRGLIHETGENIYKIFIEYDWFKPIWIGRLVNKDQELFWQRAWVTWERELKAEKIVFGNSEYYFRR